MLTVFLTAVAVVAVIGVLVEVPKIRTNHIKAPSEQKRREKAARKTLAMMIGGVLVALAVALVVF